MNEFTIWFYANMAWFIPVAAVAVIAIIVAIVVPIVVHNKKKKKARAAENNTDVAVQNEQSAESAEPAATAEPEEKEIIYRAEPVYEPEEAVEESVEDEPIAEAEIVVGEPGNKVAESGLKTTKTAEKKSAKRRAGDKSPAEIALERARETRKLSAMAAGNSIAAEEAKKGTVSEPGQAETKKKTKTEAETKKTAEKPAEKPTGKPAKKETPKRVGKWTIELKAEGEYVAKLSATNGEVMLTSEVYADKDGAVKGIATIVKNVESGKFIVYRDKNDNFYYKLKSSGNRLLCVGEIYQSKDQCERAVQSVKRIAADATVVKDVVEGKYIDYTPIPVSEIELPKGATGKWKVEKGDHGFQAKLFASNGQLMLSTEEVSTKKSATDAIESVKEYALQGNFRIDRDKSKRYYWKLRNNVKSVVCIGEAYESLDACVKSLESVRRFAATAVLEA